MPALHRINIVAPSRQKIQEMKREAKKYNMSVSKFFWLCYEYFTEPDLLDLK